MALVASSALQAGILDRANFSGLATRQNAGLAAAGVACAVGLSAAWNRCNHGFWFKNVGYILNKSEQASSLDRDAAADTTSSNVVYHARQKSTWAFLGAKRSTISQANLTLTPEQARVLPAAEGNGDILVEQGFMDAHALALPSGTKNRIVWQGRAKAVSLALLSLAAPVAGRLAYARTR